MVIWFLYLAYLLPLCIWGARSNPGRSEVFATRWLVLHSSCEFRWDFESDLGGRFWIRIAEETGLGQHAEPEGLPCRHPWQWPEIHAFRSLWWTGCADGLHLRAAEHHGRRGDAVTPCHGHVAVMRRNIPSKGDPQMGRVMLHEPPATASSGLSTIILAGWILMMGLL